MFCFWRQNPLSVFYSHWRIGDAEVPEFFRFFLSECVEMRNPVTLKDLNVSQKRLRNDLMKAPPPTQLFTI